MSQLEFSEEDEEDWRMTSNFDSVWLKQETVSSGVGCSKTRSDGGSPNERMHNVKENEGNGEGQQ